MTEFITAHVRAVHQGYAFWDTDVTLRDGDAININTTKVLEGLMAERDMLKAFVTKCQDKAGKSVSGDSLAQAATTLLAKCGDFQHQPAVDQDPQPE